MYKYAPIDPVEESPEAIKFNEQISNVHNTPSRLLLLKDMCRADLSLSFSVSPLHPLASPLSSALSMFTTTKTCQPEGGAELECDRKGTPTPDTPQSSELHREDAMEELHCEETTSGDEEMVSDFLTRWHTSRMHSSGETQLACVRNGPSTPTSPQSSDSERYISPSITCQSSGGARLERDSTAAPTPGAPLSPREAGLKSDRPALAAL